MKSIFPDFHPHVKCLAMWKWMCPNAQSQTLIIKDCLLTDQTSSGSMKGCNQYINLHLFWQTSDTKAHHQFDYTTGVYESHSLLVRFRLDWPNLDLTYWVCRPPHIMVSWARGSVCEIWLSYAAYTPANLTICANSYTFKVNAMTQTDANSRGAKRMTRIGWREHALFTWNASSMQVEDIQLKRKIRMMRS